MLICELASGKRSIARLLAASLLLLASSGSWAQKEQDRLVDFDIPAQGMATALVELGKQAGVQVVSSGQDLSGVSARAVKGRITAKAAADRLLEGTGLTATFNGGNTLVVRQKADESKARTSGPGAALPAAAPFPQGMEKITVTAQKRTELLIDVPQSVSVLTADDLARLGATQFRDFANTIPGLTFQTAGPGYTQMSLRGASVGQDIASTVAVYVDDVPFGASTTFARGGQYTLDQGLFDIERIEVLRGPQGTLYGASSVGGLLKYVTKQPSTLGFRSQVRAGLSTTRSGGVNHDVGAAVNAPLVPDTAAVRVSAFRSHDGGYIDNLALGREDVNRSDVHGGRADLLLTPNARFSARFSAFLQNTSAKGLPTADFTLAGVPIDNELSQRRRLDESFDQRFRLVSGTLTYDFDWATLTSISSYQTVRSTLFVDGTHLYLATLPPGTGAATVGFSDESNTKKFAQEVRLASPGPRTLEWIVGGFFTRERSELDAVYVLGGPSGQPLPNTVYSFFAPSTYSEAAVFGDVTWRLTEKADVTGGVRYAENRQRYEQIGGGTFGLSAAPTESTENVATYLANARYHFSSRAVGYLRYATGYRPGGPNVVVLDPTTGVRQGLPTFEADRLKSYEAGFKRESDDGSFGLELAAYYIDWSNIQINVARFGFGTKANAPGGAIVRGGEITAVARPAPGFTIQGAASFQDARMSEALPAVAAAKDERLPTVPRWTASLTSDYLLTGMSLRPTIGATVRYVGDSRSIFGPNGYPIPAYTMIDVRGGVVFGGLTLQLYVRNLTDERAQGTPRFRYFLAASPQVSILQPRTIGVMASATF